MSDTVHGLFEAQVRRAPNAGALAFQGEALTYDELNRRSNQLAHSLRDLGVGAETLVGLCMERSLEMVVGLLGILKAGGAYVPLDPSYPKERLAFMLQDTRAPAVLTQESLANVLPLTSARVVSIDRESERIAKQSELNPEAAVFPGNLAYVIYTSGSTGVPKGVQVEHASVVKFLNAMRELLDWQPTERSLFVTMLSFDIAGLEIYLPLSVGASLEVCPRAVAADPQQLARLLETSGSSAMQATPVTWRMLVDSGWSGDAGLKVLCGGEAMPWALAKELVERSSVVWNLYGPTETTIWSAAHQVGRGTSAGGLVPIGRPIANTQLYVLDDDSKPAPPGIAGELYIGGRGLARGYWNRPDLTAERFTPDHRGGEAGKRLYRTGDLARELPGGTIEFLGRSDEQVKIRGYRVELGEIEAVLLQHAAVSQAVVVGRREDGDQTHLVAYVVGSSGRLPVEELRALLGRKLPEYMIPSAFIFLDELPLTPNRKVDRRALPAPSGERPELSRPYVAPRSRTERKLVALWEEALKISPIGVEDDFFEVGGHSFHAARLFARIEKAFHRDLPPTMLFHATTIAELASLLSSKPSRKRWTSLVPIQPHGTRPPLFSIHGGAGTILIFHRLAQELGTDQPFYGLQAQGIYGNAPPHTRIEEMVAHYIREIREVQPSGPYLLLGFCVGGLIAFEMALRLLSDGEEVALLAGINAVGPPSSYRAPASAIDILHRKVARHRAASQSLNLRERLLYSFRAARASIDARSQILLHRAIPFLRAPAPRALRESFYKFFSMSVGTYVPAKPFPGVMFHFRAEAIPSEPEYLLPNLRWSGWATGGLEFHVVPGVHLRHRAIMDDPAVRTLAAQVRDVLERTRARAIRRPLAAAADSGARR